ncbi:carboxymuconolactone decarboxylase family protein [Kribbella sp. NBC_01245]|uniref:carboxymuconolactone decarboxylase family protein n=1 Tax=Kribbella sp. NBC_01245 TaxID=2903578 RepID=UPI002E27DE8A|nr:carboxymuconolactone decarboxylase family protein [Kribbella sp. NBC_01245]
MSDLLSPLAPPYDPDTEALLAKLMPPGSGFEPLRLFRLLAVHRDLADRVRPMASGLLNKGLLPARDREIVICRTTARSGAEYEWGIHAVIYGPVVGLSPEFLDALASEEATAFDGHDRLLVDAVDELLSPQPALTPATLTALRAVYTEAQVLELLLLAGWYRTLSTMILSAELPRETWAARFP